MKTRKFAPGVMFGGQEVGTTQLIEGEGALEYAASEFGSIGFRQIESAEDLKDFVIELNDPAFISEVVPQGNRFDPELVADQLKKLMEKTGADRFYFGNQSSPVMYIPNDGKQWPSESIEIVNLMLPDEVTIEPTELGPMLRLWWD